MAKKGGILGSGMVAQALATGFIIQTPVCRSTGLIHAITA
jgi:hypothetical protein